MKNLYFNIETQGLLFSHTNPGMPGFEMIITGEDELVDSFQDYVKVNLANSRLTKEDLLKLWNSQISSMASTIMGRQPQYGDFQFPKQWG